MVDRMAVVAALHESAHGPTQTYSNVSSRVSCSGQSRPIVLIASYSDPKQKCFRVTKRSSNLPYREIVVEIPASALFDVSVGKQIDNGRRVMMLKLGRIAVVSTAALTLAAATIPTKAEAFGFLLAPALIGSAFLGTLGSGDGYYGGGGGYYGGGCCQVASPPCCQVYVPPPPPPCCVYGGGYRGRYGGGYRGGYGGGYAGGYDGGYGGGYGGYGGGY
jgi:hypothetical protein